MDIWDRLVKGKITTKQAYEEINEQLKTASTSQRQQLFTLSNRIMDREVPMEERNTDIERTFMALTNKEIEE